MKTLLITIAVLASIFTNGSAFKCYHCSSTESWEDCYKMLRNETCLDTSKGCMITEIAIKGHNKTTHSYARGCAQQCNIESNPHCNQPHITCKLDCCEGNMCNRVEQTSPVTMVPTIDAISGACRTDGSYYVIGCLVVMYLIRLA